MDLKNNQDGFTAIAFAVAATALGLATMTVQNYRDQASHKIQEINMERERAKNRDAVVNAASLYKGLLAERKVSPGVYIPGIFAKDYFAENWVMKRNASVDSNDVKMKDSKGTVELKSSTATSDVLDKSTKVFKDEKSAKSVSDETIKLEIVDMKYSDDATSLVAGILVEYVDVKVSGVTGSAQKMNPVTVRVPIPPPEPRNVKMLYRAIGDATWKPVPSTMTLAPMEYEFKATASGIVVAVGTRYDTEDDKQTKYLGLSEQGRPTHKANNYEAVDEEVGTLRLDFGKSTPFDHTTCLATPVDGSHTLDMEYYTVAGKTVPMGKVKVTVTSTAQDLTVNDYRNFCSAPDQCPFVERTSITGSYPDGSIDAGDVADRFYNKRIVNGVDTKTVVGDLSGEWTFQEADHYKLKDKKLCINLDKAKPLEDPTGYFHQGELMTWTVPSCQQQFLIQRTTCGCVAEDTKILMGDGKTEKEIKLITKGEMIWNPLLKKAMPIRKMTVGPEKIPLLKVAVGSQVLSVTGNHPFPTRSGMKTAYSLSAGEEVMVEGQGWVKIGSITAVEAGAKAPNVWNIEVEAPDHDEAAHHYVANGVVTGDLMIQINLQKNAQTAQN